MKRSGPLQRKTPLKRTGYLPRVSKKRKALKAVVDPERAAFVEEAAICQNPWCPFTAGYFDLHCHEIANGPNRQRALSVRAALLVLCDHCNGAYFTDKALWPVARQCALKLLVDPEHFDLDEINGLLAPKGHPNPPRVVELKDVATYLKLI